MTFNGLVSRTPGCSAYLSKSFYGFLFITLACLQLFNIAAPLIKLVELLQINVNGIYPLVTNGLSHLNHLDESTFILRGMGSNFSFIISFFDENHVSKQNSPRWDHILRRHIWVYSVCLCHIKRTPGLYGLNS